MEDRADTDIGSGIGPERTDGVFDTVILKWKSIARLITKTLRGL